MRASLPKMKVVIVLAWTLMLAGMALWGYGYFIPGTPPLVDWQANTPLWVADFLPNLESEIGLILTCLGMVPLYWPVRLVSSRDSPNRKSGR